MKLIDSLLFRLALTYAALLLASVGTLAGLYYWIGVYRPLEAVRTDIRVDARALSSRFRPDAPEVLVAQLERRASDASGEQAYHALLRPDGSAIATNLPSWPRIRTTQWLRIDADISREGDEDEYEALILDQPLTGGWRLLVGRDIEDLEGLEEALGDAAVWLVPALLLLLLGGGFLMSRAIGGRIEAVDTAARRVMQGDFSERIPLRGTGDDFDRLAATLNLMLGRIEQSLLAVRSVSDSVAHELRTPLSRIQADLADIDGNLPPRALLQLDNIRQDADRLARMFDAVLRITRIETRRHVSELRGVDLGKLLGDAVELYEPALEEKGIALVTKLAPGLMVQGDADLLFQAASNLIDNAVKFTPSGGRITVTGDVEPDGVWFAISDTGCGVSEADRGRITERFFRASATARTQGFGLGLSLVAAVAELHGSQLEFNDAAPGLAVRWRFPRADSSH